jgi:hypothetical protein
MKPALTIRASHLLAHHQNCLLEKNMSRLLKALPLTLSLAALSLFAASCGSSSQSQVRIVHAISDGPALDIDVNTTKVFTNIAFGGVQPTPPAYTKVASGSDTLEAVNTGTTTAVIANTSASLSGSAQYTVLLTGFLNVTTGANVPTFNLITDNNAAPTSGNVEIRLIDGSANTPQGGFDIYIVPPGTNIGGLQPQISGLLIGQASSYQSLNITGNVYEVIVTPVGTQTPYINQNYTITIGSIRTLVIVDNQGGGGGAPSQFPLVLNDLN